MTDKKRAGLRRKLQESRYRLLTRAPELAYPLIRMYFVAINGIYHMSVNGSCFYFDAAWLDKLTPWSLDYALCHQLMHMKLGHLNRSRLYKGDRFHYACNIIVNAHLVEYGFIEDKLPGIGELRRQTLFPRVSGHGLAPLEAYKMSPFDPAALNKNQQSRIKIDSDFWWDYPDDRGESGILVLGPDDPAPEDLKLAHRIRGEIEYYIKNYISSENTLPIRGKKVKGGGDSYIKHDPDTEAGNRDFETEDKETDIDFDDFTTEYIESAPKNLKATVEDIRSLKSRNEDNGDSSPMTERAVREIRRIPKDWRAILNHFIMDETRDYDFTPPDRRMQELDFFLPDFNETTTPRLNVLFMVDISGSLKDKEVAMAVTELQAAIDQFGGMLHGTIGFFDTKVRKVFPIRAAQNLWQMVPSSGGGTDFECIFDYVRDEMADRPPSEIVIMTDGKADFPDYAKTQGIPVLWLLTSNWIRIPWGRAAYFRH